MTHTDDALTEAVAKAMYDLEPGKKYAEERDDGTFVPLDEPIPLLWDDFPLHRQNNFREYATAAVAAVRQFDEQAALNCGHCDPNTDEIACACTIKERDDE